MKKAWRKTICLILVLGMVFAHGAYAGAEGIIEGNTMQDETFGSADAAAGVTLNTDKTFPHGRVNPDERFETDAVSSKDTLIIRLNEDNGTLDSITGGNYNENGIIYSLTGSVLVTEGIMPDGDLDFYCNKYTLADRYEYDEDYKGITFYLKDNAYFHNGDKVMPEDVAFSVKRLQQSPFGGYLDFDNIACNDEENYVYIPFKEVRSTVLQLFGRFTHIFSEKLFKEYEEKNDLGTFFYTCPGTSGMYTITEWVNGDHVTMVADDKFFGGAPKIKNLIIRFISDQTVAMMELETGGVDLVYEPAWNDVNNVLNGDYGDTITGFSDTQTLAMALGFNLTGPLADENLRRCIQHACDWNTIVKGAYDGLAVPAYTLVSSTQFGLSNCSEWYNGLYDPELAREFMDKSPYAESGVDLVIINNGDPQKQVCAEMMLSTLKDYGIRVKIESYDTATYDAIMTGVDGWDMWLRDFGGTGNAAMSFTTMGCWINNTGAMQTEEFAEEANTLNDIGNELMHVGDPEEARELTSYIEDQYFNEGRWYWVQPICQRIQYLLFTSDLKNFSYTSSFFYIADAYFE